ncbi:MAG: outer membrane protein transport protein [Elusimicrobiales bacterium]|nr:outer membrane protein transport protein [Elusimicrobiales bacterium]
MKRFFTAVLLSIFTVSISNAAGFRLADQSATAGAMGNAFVAVASDASAVWHNPAAIVDLEGTQISLGSIMVYPLTKHEYAGGSDSTKKKLHIPPHFYSTHKYNENLSFGLGINAPFGLSTEWADTSSTKYIATFSEINVINFNLNAAYKLQDNFYFAFGLNCAKSNATLESIYPYAPFTNKNYKLTGNAWTFGYNTSFIYKYSDNLSFGANYRSKLKFKINGKSKVSTVTVDVKTKLTTPDMLQIGAAYKCNNQWLFSTEADYTNWTTYKNLVIEQSAPLITVIQTKNWKSVWALRFGTEYTYSPAWKFRGGFFYDFNPIKDQRFETRMPDSDRFAFSLGAGYKNGNMTIDVMYQYVNFIERTIINSYATGATPITSLNGKYSSSAHLPGITIGYKF